MNGLGKIVSVEAAPDRSLRVTWDDGVSALISLDHLIQTRHPLSPLSKEEEFGRVDVSADGWSVEWPSGIDFGASQLRQWAKLKRDEKVGA